MGQHATPTQESKSERAAIALTPSEKRAVRAVAALRGTDESNLIRTTLIADVVAEFERLGGVTAIPAEATP